MKTSLSWILLVKFWAVQFTILQLHLNFIAWSNNISLLCIWLIMSSASNFLRYLMLSVFPSEIWWILVIRATYNGCFSRIGKFWSVLDILILKLALISFFKANSVKTISMIMILWGKNASKLIFWFYNTWVGDWIVILICEICFESLVSCGRSLCISITRHNYVASDTGIRFYWICNLKIILSRFDKVMLIIPILPSVLKLLRPRWRVHSELMFLQPSLILWIFILLIHYKHLNIKIK